MRIVVVSAHFPPNFVSGGTLQPQRLAHELRLRGHDVRVYAGWLGDEHPPGHAWCGDDGAGLPVRWISLGAWIGWDDDRNYRNPAVERDFRAFLGDARPDVVHLHALQGLGGGLVAAASEAGTAVVVTMHDFWWCCARQFLVDPARRPCCPVVDAGVCPCAVDHTWLLERNAWLRAQLRRADLVLAPSESAAAVLRANGIRFDRLDVDENGVQSALPTSAGAATAAGTATVGGAREVLRFIYAGGSNELKGVDVVMQACRTLGPRSGWRLRAYGARPWVEERGFDLSDLPVELVPAFAPAEIDAVMGDADVLVLPSITRESHSLLTREALARSLAVITSDCLGPEEVVADGRNGLIVPTGDARALAAAMAKLIDDRDLVRDLRQPGTPVELRSLADQAEGLEARYQELLGSGEEDVRRASRRVRRVLFVVGIDGAPLRYRVHLPAEALGAAGVRTKIRWFTDPSLPRLAAWADAVVIYRVPVSDWIIDFVARVRRRGTVPVVFDADDLIFDPDIAGEVPALQLLGADEAALWLEGVARYRATMDLCDAYIASTPELAHHATHAVGLPVERFDNGVGWELGRLSDTALRRPWRAGPPRIGYFSGTDTHDRDWAMIEPAVAAVLDRHPDVELWLVGFLHVSAELDRFGSRVVRLPFQPWRELPALLRHLDVNLAPLEPGSRFNEAKSAVKWLEAALVATPTVASPTAPFRDAIDHEANGLIAATPDEWISAIDGLLNDPVRRARLGNRARRDALLRWSPHVQGPRYIALLERSVARVVGGRPPARPVEPDLVVIESPRPHEIEPYTEVRSANEGVLGVALASAAERARRERRRAVRAVQRDGWKHTAARLARAATRRLRGRRS